MTPGGVGSRCGKDTTKAAWLPSRWGVLGKRRTPNEDRRGFGERRRITRAADVHGRLSLGLILLVGLLVPLGCSRSREAKGNTTTDTREAHRETTPELHRVTDQEGNVYTITARYVDSVLEP